RQPAGRPGSGATSVSLQSRYFFLAFGAQFEALADGLGVVVFTAERVRSLFVAGLRRCFLDVLDAFVAQALHEVVDEVGRFRVVDVVLPRRQRFERLTGGFGLLDLRRVRGLDARDLAGVAVDLGVGHVRPAAVVLGEAVVVLLPQRVRLFLGHVEPFTRALVVLVSLGGLLVGCSRGVAGVVLQCRHAVVGRWFAAASAEGDDAGDTEDGNQSLHGIDDAGRI